MKKSKILKLSFLPLVVLGIFGINLLFSHPVHTLNFTFFEAPQQGGYNPWNHSANTAKHNAWLAAIGEAPDYREDWEGNNWSNGKMFDSQLTPITFGGGAKFSNLGPDGSSRAYASNNANDNLGGTQPIGNLAWRGHETNTSTINFGSNLADYLGFYIFDTDHPSTKVTYNIEFSDGTRESIVGKNAYQNHYLFVGFVNTHSTAAFKKFWITSYKTSRYGIDELEWAIAPFPNLLIPNLPFPNLALYFF